MSIFPCHWRRELLDRGELHLFRNKLPQVQATQRATHPAENSSDVPKTDRYIKANVTVYLTEVALDPPVSED